MYNKIKNRKNLKRILSSLKRRGKRIVFTNGCFDILHIGHASYLKKAKEKGDILVVAVNADHSLRRIKGKGRPITKLKERMLLLASLESEDFVTSFSEDTPDNNIRELKPDVLIKGSDWKNKTIVGSDTVKKLGGRVATIPLYKGRSTTAMIRKIKALP